MSGVMQFEFRLFGPRKGHTVMINGHPFVNGFCTIVQSSVNLGTVAKVLGYYRAYARGTPEYDAAMAAEEAENGTNEAPETSLEGANPAAQARVGSDGTGPAEVAANGGGGDAEPNGAGGASGDPSGDGHEHAGIPKFPEDADYRAEEPASSINGDIVAALRKLDPEVDSHWVMTGAHKGKPKLQAVEDAYGKAGLTRQDLEAAAPGWNRDAAIEAALVA